LAICRLAVLIAVRVLACGARDSSGCAGLLAPVFGNDLVTAKQE
jgi:hypothetical protein